MNPHLVFADPARLGPQIAQDFQDVLDIRYPWRVGDRARLVTQDGSSHELQHGVLGARDRHRPAQWHAAFDHVRAGRSRLLTLAAVAAAL